MSVIDILLYSELCTIVEMYTRHGRLNESKFDHLVPWMDRMVDDNTIEELKNQAKGIIQREDLYGNMDAFETWVN